MLREIIQDLPLSLAVGLAFVAFLLLWRLWMFTLKPMMWPSYPHEIPYWVPCHTVEFFWNSDKLIERGLDYTYRTYEPFSLQLLGKKFYIVTSPTDVTATFRDTTALSFDGNLKQLLQNFGVTTEAFAKAWHKPNPGDWCYIPNNPVNPNHLDLIHFVEETYKKQLLPGEHIDKLCGAFIDSLLTSLQWDRLDFCTDAFYEQCIWCSDCSDSGTVSLRQGSLYTLCRFFIVEATTRSLFGCHLHDIDPDIVESMLQFNDHAWMVVFKYPSIFRNPVAKSRKKLLAALTKFIQLPEEKRPQQCWAVKNILAAMEIVGIDIESRASMMLMSFWAAVSNEYNAAFWVLAYILCDGSLLQKVKLETEAAWQSGRLDVKYLCANAPYLDSVFHETLRVKNGAGALRVVTKETQIGGKLLEVGNPILIPFRQLHNNENVWGPTVKDFDPYRFLEKKGLARHPSFRPFGGGATFCPGRALAKEEVFGFIAILFHRFNVKVAQDPKVNPQFPLLNVLTPSLGISGPMKGMDLTVRLSQVRGRC